MSAKKQFFYVIIFVFAIVSYTQYFILTNLKLKPSEEINGSRQKNPAFGLVTDPILVPPHRNNKIVESQWVLDKPPEPELVARSQFRVIPDDGGRLEGQTVSQTSPRPIVVWSSWRSGSTFLGDLLARAVPNTFYRCRNTLSLWHCGVHGIVG